MALFRLWLTWDWSSRTDRAYVLETGHVVMDGTGAELLTNERVRNAYLGG